MEMKREELILSINKDFKDEKILQLVNLFGEPVTSSTT
jgi:hypothetical protein